MVVPSGPQPIGAAATVRPIPETAAIESDLVLAPTEEIVEVVNAAPVDELLDDRPVFLPELQAAARPEGVETIIETVEGCLLYTSPSPRDRTRSRMPSSA